MTIDQAKSFQMTCGKFKGIELSKIPMHYLKWLSKNWIHKEVRDAAVLVVNARGEDVGEKPKYRPLYNSNPERVFQGMEFKAKNAIDYANGAFGKLKEELEAMEPGLF